MSSNILFDKYGRTIDAGTYIFRENDEGDRMFIIQEGKVRISKLMDGKEHILAVLEKGDFFGEMAIVTNSKRTASALAVGDVKLLAFDRQGFLSMIEKNAKIALNMIDRLCRRLQHANLQIQHLVKNNERSLIALNLFYAFTEKDKDKGFLAYDRVTIDIALNLSLPAKTVHETIDTFIKTNILKMEANNLILLDKAKLEEIAE